MRAIALTLVVLTLAGCSTSALSPEDASPVPPSLRYAFQKQVSSNDAKVSFTRDAGFSGAACDFVVSINGVKAASIGISETATFYHAPGPAIISVSPRTICTGALQELSVNLEPGMAYQFRGFRSASGDPGISATGRPPYRYAPAAASMSAPSPATATGMMAREQWVQHCLEQLNREAYLVDLFTQTAHGGRIALYTISRLIDVIDIEPGAD